MNREVHVRFWESPEVKILRATRHQKRRLPRYLYGSFRQLWTRGRVSLFRRRARTEKLFGLIVASRTTSSDWMI